MFESGGRVRSVFYTVVRVVSFFGDGAFYCRGRVVRGRGRRRRRRRRSWCLLVLAFRIGVGIRVVVRVVLGSGRARDSGSLILARARRRVCGKVGFFIPRRLRIGFFDMT